MSANRNLVILLAGVTMPSTFQSAQAQTPPRETVARGPADDTPLGEIIVTARKRAEVLTKIPETIQAITEGTIARAGIRSLDDLGRQVPNVLLNRRQDNEPNVVIRGVGSFGNVQGVGFYVDDVQNFTDQSAAIEDVERIEVLKGPQGTLYGGSDVGGAIKYILKKPTFKWGGEAFGEYGSFGTRNLYGAVNVPIVSDRLAARISAYWNHVDGFVANTLAGGKADRFDEYGTRLAISWKPSDAIDVQFSYRHNQVKDGGNIYTRSINPGQYVRTLAYNLVPTNDRIVDGGILQVQYSPGPVTVTSITSYTDKKNAFDWDVDYSPAPASEAKSVPNFHTPVFTQELRLTSRATGAFDWIGGLYYSDIKNQIQTIQADLFLGVPPKQRIILDYNNGKTDLTQYAAFLTGNLKLGQFRIDGGARVNRAQFEGEILTPTLMIKHVNHTSILPKLSIAFDANAHTMLYANVSVGEEPGKVNVLNGTGGAYRNESALSFEAGIKGQLLDRKLSYDLAGFYIDYRRRQFETIYINADNVLTKETQNIGRSVNYGVEGSLSYHPIRALNFGIAGGYLDAKWKNGVYNQASVAGLEVPYAPKFTLNTFADVHVPVGSELEAGLRADLTHTGSFYWDVPNQARQPSYDVVNLRASLGKIGASWEIAARVENLLDAQYYTTYGFNAAPAVGALPRSIGAPSMPRRVLGSIALKF